MNSFTCDVSSQRTTTMMSSSGSIQITFPPAPSAKKLRGVAAADAVGAARPVDTAVPPHAESASVASVVAGEQGERADNRCGCAQTG